MTAPTSFATVPEALAYLESLGSPDAIAEDLRQRGIRADPEDCERCAVARFLHGVVAGGVDDVFVEPELAPYTGMVSWHDSYLSGARPLPAQVNAFALAFDRKDYRELLDWDFIASNEAAV